MKTSALVKILAAFYCSILTACSGDPCENSTWVDSGLCFHGEENSVFQKYTTHIVEALDEHCEGLAQEIQDNNIPVYLHDVYRLPDITDETEISPAGIYFPSNGTIEIAVKWPSETLLRILTHELIHVCQDRIWNNLEEGHSNSTYFGYCDSLEYSIPKQILEDNDDAIIIIVSSFCLSRPE